MFVKCEHDDFLEVDFLEVDFLEVDFIHVLIYKFYDLKKFLNLI